MDCKKCAPQPQQEEAEQVFQRVWNRVMPPERPEPTVVTPVGRKPPVNTAQRRAAAEAARQKPGPAAEATRQKSAPVTEAARQKPAPAAGNTQQKPTQPRTAVPPTAQAPQTIQRVPTPLTREERTALRGEVAPVFYGMELPRNATVQAVAGISDVAATTETVPPAGVSEIAATTESRPPVGISEIAATTEPSPGQSAVVATETTVPQAGISGEAATTEPGNGTTNGTGNGTSNGNGATNGNGNGNGTGTPPPEEVPGEEVPGQAVLPWSESCAAGLEGFMQEMIRREVTDWHHYRCLARKVSGSASRTLNAMAAEEMQMAKRLSAVWFLVSGERSWPEKTGPVQLGDYPNALRDRYLQELQDAGLYDNAATECSEAEFGDVFTEAAQLNRRHAQTLRELVEQL